MKFLKIKSDSQQDLFFKIGKILAKKIQRRTLIQKRKWGGKYTYLSKKALEVNKLFTEKFFPQYYKELLALSQGAGVNFEDILLANTSDIYDLKEEQCTTLAYMVGDKIYFGHNEDETSPDYKKDAYCFYLINEKDKMNYFGFGVCRSLIGASVSISNNVIQFVNTLTPKKVKLGIPRNIISRMILDVKTIDELKEKLNYLPRFSSYHHTIFFRKEKKLYSLEYNSFNYVLKEIKFNNIKKIFFHTNHFIFDKFKNNYYASESSLSRFEILKKKTKNINKIEDIFSLLSDKENFPLSILREATIYSVVLSSDLKEIFLSTKTEKTEDFFKLKINLFF